MAMVTLPPLPASKVLLGGRTLLLLPSLVGMVGLNEAIVLQQVRYRLGDDLRPRVRDGRRWVRDPLERWRERDFPFWEIDTLRRAFQSLEERGLLLSEQFEKHLRDRTKWYTIDFDALERRERDYRAARSGTPPPPGRRRAVWRATQAAGDGAAADSDATAARAGGPLPPLPASDLLIDEPPLLIVVELAVAIGLDEALILQQIRYWLADERRPPVREYRRWVCPREVELFAPLAFRSGKTLARALRALERAGLLLASDRFNRLPGDRTKWYTIDFERVAALASLPDPVASRSTVVAGPEGQYASIQEDRIPLSSMTECQTPAAQFASIERDEVRSSSGPECESQSAILHGSLKDSETDPETETQNQQQQVVTWPVVVDPIDTIAFAETMLRNRGITPSVARELAHRDPIRVTRQVEIYDWLCERDLDDDRLTPGRLRRMIEEDWSPPPGFVSAAVREQRAREAAEAERLARGERARWVAEHEARRVREEDERRGTLARIGVTDEDQRVWRRVLELPRPLASPLAEPLRRALFYAPRDGNPALVIMRDEAELALVSGERHASGRAEIDRRVAKQYHRPYVEVRYAYYAMIASLLHDGVDGATESSVPVTSAGIRQNAK